MRWLVFCLGILCGPAAGDLPAPVTDDMFAAVDMAQVRLGQTLFYDPILSGNRNISCATCHHPKFATSDGLPLGLGEGAVGIGPDRHVLAGSMPEQRIPRHSPALFNLGAQDFTVLFHDGRIEVDPSKPGGLRTPMGEDMAQGFANLLSAQTMFPVLSPDEMAGHYSENDVAQAVRQGRITGTGGAWDILSQRVRETPGYAPLIDAAFPQEQAFGFTHISDAIAAFVAFEWRSDDSPFDAHLRGEAPLVGPAAEGLELFYGSLGCATCHSGPFLTDHRFHAMGVPQFGPGKAARFETHVRDLGRARVTGIATDAYAFRTPSLRNVAKTGPYGHTGSHTDLSAFIHGHMAPRVGLDRFDRSTVRLPDLPAAQDWTHLETPADQSALRAAIAVPERSMTQKQSMAIVSFLETLTDPVAVEGRLGVPETVPSGLPVER